jgi:hypothetical protein
MNKLILSHFSRCPLTTIPGQYDSQGNRQHVHAANRLVFDDGPPMGMLLFCRHLFPPIVEDSSLSGSTEGKIGLPDAYVLN